MNAQKIISLDIKKSINEFIYLHNIMKDKEMKILFNNDLPELYRNMILYYFHHDMQNIDTIIYEILSMIGKYHISIDSLLDGCKTIVLIEDFNTEFDEYADEYKENKIKINECFNMSALSIYIYNEYLLGNREFSNEVLNCEIVLSNNINKILRYMNKIIKVYDKILGYGK